jgi:DNA modification methylase
MDNIDGINLLDDESVDLTFTSPPYFNAKHYSKYETVNNYLEIMKNTFFLIFGKTKKSKICAVNISPIIVPRKNRSCQSYRIPLPFYFVPLMENIGWEFLEDIIWEKPSGSSKNRGGGFFQHRKPIAYKPNIVSEYILVFKKPAPFLIDKVLRNNSLVLGEYEKTNIWKIQPETKSSHPAPFPEKLADNVIKYWSYKDDIVLDPFMGSGTTAKMAKLNNRNFIGFEISQEYCDMANKRIEILKEQ